MSPEAPPGMYDTSIAACTNCHHAWKAGAEWVYVECPKCGAFVVRTANRDWD